MGGVIDQSCVKQKKLAFRRTLCTEPVLGQVIVETTKKKTNCFYIFLHSCGLKNVRSTSQPRIALHSKRVDSF